MELFQLVYISQASQDISYADILSILKHSRAANSLFEITGALIYRDGEFLQVMEGSEKQVRSLLEKIRRDLRHQSLKIVVESKIADRLFPNQSMIFFDGDLAGKGMLEVETLFDATKLGPRGCEQIQLQLHAFRNLHLNFVS